MEEFLLNTHHTSLTCVEQRVDKQKMQPYVLTNLSEDYQQGTIYVLIIKPLKYLQTHS